MTPPPPGSSSRRATLATRDAPAGRRDALRRGDPAREDERRRGAARSTTPATRSTGRPVNPHDRERGAGDPPAARRRRSRRGCRPGASGSDLGSSIRNPAHFTGIFGLLPSRAWSRRAGSWPPDATPGLALMARVGPMARSAEDLELMLRARWPPPGTARGRADDARRDPGRARVSPPSPRTICSQRPRPAGGGPARRRRACGRRSRRRGGAAPESSRGPTVLRRDRWHRSDGGLATVRRPGARARGSPHRAHSDARASGTAERGGSPADQRPARRARARMRRVAGAPTDHDLPGCSHECAAGRGRVDGNRRRTGPPGRKDAAGAILERPRVAGRGCLQCSPMRPGCRSGFS